jgi:hypothetical protein
VPEAVHLGWTCHPSLTLRSPDAGDLGKTPRGVFLIPKDEGILSGQLSTGSLPIPPMPVGYRGRNRGLFNVGEFPPFIFNNNQWLQFALPGPRLFRAGNKTRLTNLSRSQAAIVTRSSAARWLRPYEE